MLVAVLVVLSALAVGTCSAQTNGEDSSSPYDWDFFVFGEICPGGDSRAEYGGKKNFRQNSSRPAYHSTWVMHGMWPSSSDHPNPAYCNNNTPFDIQQVKDLLPRLMIDWPTLAPPKDWGSCPKNRTQIMWCHEWNRHGTCAADIPELSTQHGYFSKVLSLFENRMNFDTFVLAKHGIVPNTTHTYKLSEIVSAFEKSWNNTHPVVVCDCHQGHQFLDQIYVCLTRDYQLMKCPESVYRKHNCDSDEPIYYLPWS